MDTQPVTPPAEASFDSVFGVPCVLDGVLCVHFSADGREHSMWLVDANEPGPALSGFTAGLRAEWDLSPAGVARASVFRQSGNALCDAVFLSDPAGPNPDGTPGADARRDEAAILRGEGLTSQQASLISRVRQRPLLATFARRMDLPAPLARGVHTLLLRTAPKDAPRLNCCHSNEATGY